MQFRTVGELREALEELPDEMPIMAQYQQSWPLREVIGGIWVDDGREDEEEEEDEDGEPKTVGVDFVQVAYLVLNGHPYEGPYGDKRAWNEL